MEPTDLAGPPAGQAAGTEQLTLAPSPRNRAGSPLALQAGLPCATCSSAAGGLMTSGPAIWRRRGPRRSVRAPLALGVSHHQMPARPSGKSRGGTFAAGRPGRHLAGPAGAGTPAGPGAEIP
jgi:hypothetical protein